MGVINNFGGFYKTEFYFHEARMNGAQIEAPCVNHSEYLTTIDGTKIYIGFVHLKSLETKVAKQVQAERIAGGNFKSLDNFLRRIDLGLEQVRILIRIGAFRFTRKRTVSAKISGTFSPIWTLGISSALKAQCLSRRPVKFL